MDQNCMDETGNDLTDLRISYDLLKLNMEVDDDDQTKHDSQLLMCDRE